MHRGFDYYTHAAFRQLPDEFKSRLNNVEIFVEDFPSQIQAGKLKLRRGHTLLGLYEGIPLTKRGNYGFGGVMPDKITLFRYPILTLAQNETHLVKLIKDTLYHEIGHHFGMSEEELVIAQKT